MSLKTKDRKTKTFFFLSKTYTKEREAELMKMLTTL